MSTEPITITPDCVRLGPDANGDRILANGAAIEQGARIGMDAVIGQGSKWIYLSRCLQKHG